MRFAVALAAASVGIAFGASASQASAPAPIVFAADRAPTVTGEIYRVDPNGHRVDLSRSPYQDTNPAVSSDGRHVAFISNRNGNVGVYEVGINGRGLVNVARHIDRYEPDPVDYGNLAWQPNGRLLAATSEAGVSIVERGHKPIQIRDAYFAASEPWSLDGKVLLLARGFRKILAFSPEGHILWTHTTGGSPASWSSTGLVAVPDNRDVSAYDETGRLRFRAARLPRYPSALAWSADGRRLAIRSGVSNNNLEVTTDTGARLLGRKRVPVGNLGWIGDTKVIVGESDSFCPHCSAVKVDVRTGKISPASNRWLDTRSTDGKLAIVTSGSNPEFEVGAASLKTGKRTSYTTVGACMSDGSWLPALLSPQFAGRSIVYENWSYCDPPFDNLYSAVGTTIHRLTNDLAQETQPVASPDGTEIAYVWAGLRGFSCKGCSDGIRIASSAGAPIRTLTDPEDCIFDDSPTWSPSGTTILYAETGCDNPGELFTIPAAGGAPTDLGLAGVNPAWGPSLIAYEGALDTSGGIWTANPNGSNPTKIANKGWSPAWSATGTLAYLVAAATAKVGPSTVHLPFNSVISIAWSPDGTRFVVDARTTKTDFYDVYTVKTDGTDPVRLTKHYDASGASWG